MSIVNQVLSGSSPLAALLGDSKNSHVGFVYGMDFREALVLTNDAWKERVAGIPHNSFLVAAAFDPEQMARANELEKEVVLLRVLGPAPLPTDTDLLRTRVEHNQRRTEDELFPKDARDGLDPMTHGELQYGALRCRILGTFYVVEGELKLGSDLENYFSSTKLRVFKPRGPALETIINHLNPETRAAMRENARKSGFMREPVPLEIGEVRYTSTDRLHRGPREHRVPVYIQPSDFFARRTAVLGMTRTGKSNTVKTTVAAVAMAALGGSVKVGQIIFDLNGEYANANHQDDDSSIAKVFGEDCIRYRAADTKGFEDLRLNFYEQPAQAADLIRDLFRKEPPSGFSGQDLETFLGSTLEEPDRSSHSEHNRWEALVGAFRCMLHRAGYKAPPGYKVEVPLSGHLTKQVKKFADSQDPPINCDVPADSRLPLDEACNWFDTLRRINLAMRKVQEDTGKAIVGIESSTKNNPWVSPVMEAYMNMLARKTSRDQQFGGYRAIGGYTGYHSPKRTGAVEHEIVRHLHDGKVVILDLTVGPDAVRDVLAKRIAHTIFTTSLRIMNAADMPPNIVVYVEEAHNLIGKKDELTDTWPRLAKEGAKAKIAFVYATQEPSSIHPNILANTENWFVTHLNNDDELKALSKYYDFADFQDSLKTAQDVGFARIKTFSSPFVLPTQIKRFTPAKLVEEIARLRGGLDLV